jgi:hypothetical protein
MNVLERRTTWIAAVAAVATAAALAAVAYGGALAYDCGSDCRSAYNQCRIKTNDAPSCGEQFTRCMQSCRKR